MTPDLFSLRLQALTGIALTPGQREQFARYLGEMLEWNRRVNLTGITVPEQVEVKHFLDSLACLAVLPAGPLAIVDVGTGAGLPGLALKIVRPELAVTLLDATAKKTAFLEHVVRALGLSGVTVVTRRAEEAGQDPAYRERFDWALARAVAELRELAEYLLPLVRVGGHALAQKGPAGPDEAAGAGGALHKLGGRLAAVQPVTVPGLDEARFLIVLDKIAATPRAYPRRPGIPHKKPLE